MIPSRFLPPLLLATGLFGAALFTPAEPASFAAAMIGPLILAASVAAAGMLRTPPRRHRVQRAGALGFAAVVLLGSAIVAWVNPGGVAAAVVTFGAAAVILVLPMAEGRRHCPPMPGAAGAAGPREN